MVSGTASRSARCVGMWWRSDPILTPARVATARALSVVAGSSPIISYAGAETHRHVHGANLAFRSTAYTAVGGFAPRSTGEDVDLLSRFERRGHRIAWLRQWTVETSDRRRGRAPNGFAAHLLSLEPSTTQVDAPNDRHTRDRRVETGAAPGDR